MLLSCCGAATVYRFRFDLGVCSGRIHDSMHEDIFSTTLCWCQSCVWSVSQAQQKICTGFWLFNPLPDHWHLSCALQARLASLKVDTSTMKEKNELVEALVSGCGSTDASCSICCEDYQSEDVLRVLPCGHKFHLQCIDRWFLSSTDYSRPVACPYCNTPLLSST